MIKILTISLGVNPYIAVFICFVVTMAYSVAAGMWAVLWTDLVQFVIKMSAVIILAIYAVNAVGGMTALKTKVIAHFGGESAALSVLPVHVTSHGIEAYAWMPLLTLGVFLGMQWWAAWYPGAEPGGGGYIAQRIFSARRRNATACWRHSRSSWLITRCGRGLGFSPGSRRSCSIRIWWTKSPATCTPSSICLPTPWRGFMMAGFAAAYMSTVATQLNWGASYLINDFYKRFVNKTGTEHHYVTMSRLATVFLFLASVLVTWQLSSVEQAWRLLLALGAGTGLVFILRWYWWRINAWSEISAMITSFVVSLYVFGVPQHLMAYMSPTLAALFPVPAVVRKGGPNADAWVMIITVCVTTVVWIAVTFATAPERQETLEAFYARVRPGGPGWERISTAMGLGREPIPGGSLAWTNWIAGIVAVYASLFGIGKVLFGEVALGVGMLLLALAALAWIAKSFQNEAPPPSAIPVRAQVIAAD